MSGDILHHIIRGNVGIAAFLKESGEDSAERLGCVCQVSGRRETSIEPHDMSTVRHACDTL
jgi:hypothetical protein